MTKPHILNRSMFNRGGTSAYGRGITSNLVTEEQRQRFNYGGRVRANVGFYSGNEFDPIERTAPGFSWNFPRASELFGYEDRINRPDWMVKREKQQELMGLEDPEDYAGDYSDVLEQDKVVEKVDGTNEVMTDSDWMDLLGPTEKQKRTTKGEAQLGLAAGALDVFSQPTIAKGMKAASPHLSKLAQTASADQKARDKAILQGKVLSKVYTDRAAAKGKADVELAKYKVDAIKAAETPRARYFAGLDAKQGMKKSMTEALGYPIQTIKKDKQGLPIIPEGTTEETIMWDADPGGGFLMLKGGKLIAVTETQIFGIET